MGVGFLGFTTWDLSIFWYHF